MGVSTQLLQVRQTGSTRLTGVVSGAAGLQQYDAGTLTLEAGNTYTGATSVIGGVLRLLSNAGLGTTAGSTTVSPGATLSLFSSVFSLDGVNSSEFVTLFGAGVGGTGALRNDGGSNTWSGGISLGSDVSLGSLANVLEITSTLNGSQTITKVGTGGIALSGNNVNYAGSIIVSAGRSTPATAALAAQGRPAPVVATRVETGGRWCSGTRASWAPPGRRSRARRWC
jgi:autotransporter-associated beta strand protein